MPRLAEAGLVFAYLTAYVALDWVSYIDPIGPLGITPWNPPPGLSLFLLLRYGLGYAPWLFVAAGLAEVLVRGGPAPWPVLIVACGVLAAGYTTVAALLRRRFRIHHEFATLHDTAVFTATVVAATAIIAMLYVGTFAVAGLLPTGRLFDSVAQFWIGDLIGVVVETPALLTAARIEPTAARRPSAETMAQVGAIVLALAVVFGSGLAAELKLFYVLFIPLIWIAMRRGVAGTTWSILLVQVGLIAALDFGGHRPGEFLDFQFLMLALALTGLFLGVTVEERRAAEHKLREKQFELDRSLRAAAASELASALAHELNQPLSAVASYTRACQLLLAGGDPDRELMQTLNKVVSEANRAGTVVRRLRELVRSGALRQEKLALQALLEAAADAASSRTQRHGIAVSVIADGDLPDALGDRGQLETVLHNLIVNAVDALRGQRGSRTIRLSAEIGEPGFLRVTVADDGPGVPQRIAATLFQPLASSKSDGLGLGLAISRTIVEAHGGRLWLDSVGPGACFCLSLPVAT
ncbi:MAG: ATP-binding protein [Steroidobacterales bacterium]